MITNQSELGNQPTVNQSTPVVKSIGESESTNQSELEQQAIELLGDKWEDFKEYVDGIDDWDMSDVERYMNR